jgi:hypothetical protein
MVDYALNELMQPAYDTVRGYWPAVRLWPELQRVTDAGLVRTGGRVYLRSHAPQRLAQAAAMDQFTAERRVNDVHLESGLPWPDGTPSRQCATCFAPAPTRSCCAGTPHSPLARSGATSPTAAPRRRTCYPASYGVAKGRLPRYVLIIGTPQEIPWSVQYALGTRRAVGRLPLAGDALGNYVTALLDGWAGADVDVRAPLQWTVDIPGDITAEMRAVLANPLQAQLTDDRLPRSQHLTDEHATRAELWLRWPPPSRP